MLIQFPSARRLLLILLPSKRFFGEVFPRRDEPRSLPAKSMIFNFAFTMPFLRKKLRRWLMEYFTFPRLSHRWKIVKWHEIWTNIHSTWSQQVFSDYFLSVSEIAARNKVFLSCQDNIRAVHRSIHRLQPLGDLEQMYLFEGRPLYCSSSRHP